jgi:hypothetical protein
MDCVPILDFHVVGLDFEEPGGKLDYACSLNGSHSGGAHDTEFA